MVARRIKIKESFYKQLVYEMDKKEARKAMEEVAPEDWKFGYGIYGAEPREEDGEFYIVYQTGSSCD